MPPDLNNAESLAPTKSRRKHWHILGAMVLALVLIAVAGLMYISSDGFHERMRQNAVAMLNQSTGGRAELKSLEWSLPRLTVGLTDLTIHGRESEKDAPFMHVGKVTASIKIISL